MKIVPKYLFIAISLLLFACEKGLPTYSGATAIYFSNSADSTKLTFAYAYASVKDSLVKVRVNIMGPAINADREFNVSFMDTMTTAKRDTNFILLNDPLVIPAGRSFVDLQFKLLRTPDLVSKTYIINVTLVPNENFTTDYTWDWTNLTTKKWRQLMVYTIMFDDIFSQPKAWQPAVFGTFTRKKMYAVSEYFDIPIEKWNITSGADRITPTLWQAYGKVFQRYLNAEAKNGNVIMDEDGKPMVMGTSSQ